jgi:hypothetical protein
VICSTSSPSTFSALSFSTWQVPALFVAAAAVLQAQLADVGLRGAVDDRLADRERGVLLLESPQHVIEMFCCGNIA